MTFEDAIYLTVMLTAFLSLILIVSILFEVACVIPKGYARCRAWWKRRWQIQHYTKAEAWKALGLRLYR